MARHRINWEAIRRLPILEVAAILGINIQGKNALCFGGHDNKTKSLHFSVEENLWHCFGCGRGGSVVELVREARDFPSTLEAALWIQRHLLHGLAAIRIPDKSVGTSRYSEAAPKSPSEKVSPFCSDPEIYEWVLEQCPLLEAGTRYLHVERGFNKATIDYFRVGELNTDRRLISELREHWSGERLARSGLLVGTSDPKGPRLVWWTNVILFPFVVQRRVLYIQARRKDDKLPRYINLRGVRMPMFNLSSLDTAGLGDDVYVCEGIPDTMTAHQLGLRAVGCLGANAFTEAWARLLAPFRVTVIPDGDSGGERFYANVKKAMAALGHSAERIRVPPGEDFSSASQKGLLAVNKKREAS
jgi:DNA primase